MVAPIALYPDTLLGDILMAATYPLEVVEASRWLQNPDNAALHGDVLVVALQKASWDPSVKTLIAFPQVLRMMDSNLDWTEQLGDAFLANQSAVMDAVQRLRQRAQSAGNLHSTAQETITWDGPDSVIAPAEPQTVYVPVYDPAVVFGIWAYPEFPPDYFPGYFGDVGIDAFGFGWFGFGIVAPLWGWDHWDWRGHRMVVDADHVRGFDRHPQAGGVWAHNPAHRQGVPYTTPALRDHYAAAPGRLGADEARGFAPAASPQAAPRIAPQAPPSFESFGSGADVREEEDRGRSSRMSAPSFESHAPSSMPRGGSSPSVGRSRR
jgi:hypothetical protein